MRFSFGRLDKKRVKDALKVMDFMDDNKIEYDITGDLGVAVGQDEALPQLTHGAIPQEIIDPDPLWQPSDCPQKCCDSRDKMKCKHRCHYGAVEL